jgi:hypothetical protein
MFKRLVEMWLYDFRKELFENESLYTHQLPDNGSFQDHPMLTFGYWLDYIENCKGLPEYRNWFADKQKLVNLIRVGNAVLPRHEWRSKYIKAPADLIQAKNQNLAQK